MTDKNRISGPYK